MTYFQSSLLLCSLLISGYPAYAVPKLATAKLEGQTVNDLPIPYNIQAVTLNQTVTLNWLWTAPDPGPAFQAFGYDVSRDSQIVTITPDTAFTDYKVPVGTHIYRVRAKGTSTDLGKKAAHYSDWSEPTYSTVNLTCAGVPSIQLTVEPTKKIYGSIPSLRLHFVGQVKVPKGCTAEKIMFHIDSGLSTERAGPLTIDSHGRFDEFVDAMGGEEEPITVAARFAITVSAKDELGDAVSNVYTIDMEQENPFAPKQHDPSN